MLIDTIICIGCGRATARRCWREFFPHVRTALHFDDMMTVTGIDDVHNSAQTARTGSIWCCF